MRSERNSKERLRIWEGKTKWEAIKKLHYKINKIKDEYNDQNTKYKYRDWIQYSDTQAIYWNWLYFLLKCQIFKAFPFSFKRSSRQYQNNYPRLDRKWTSQASCLGVQRWPNNKQQPQQSMATTYNKPGRKTFWFVFSFLDWIWQSNAWSARVCWCTGQPGPHAYRITIRTQARRALDIADHYGSFFV